MELLFKNEKSLKIQCPTVNSEEPLRIRHLLPFIRDHIKPDRPELFMQENTM